MKRIKLLALGALILLFCAFGTTFSVYAEEIETPTETQLTQTETEDKTLLEVLKDYFLPVLVGTGTSLAGVLFLAFPLIKKNLQVKTLDKAYRALAKTVKDYEEREKAEKDIDYVGIVKDTLTNLAAEIKSENEDNIAELQKDFADILATIKTLQAATETIISAATVAWQSKPAAVETLATAPSASALKKEVVKNEMLKDELMKAKGEEAEKIIAGIDDAV